MKVMAGSYPELSLGAFRHLGASMRSRLSLRAEYFRLRFRDVLSPLASLIVEVS